MKAVVTPTLALQPELLPIVRWKGMLRMAWAMPLFQVSRMYSNPVWRPTTERWLLRVGLESVDFCL